MSLKSRTRTAVRKTGFDVRRFPPGDDPLRNTVRLLAMHGVDCIVDVGANDGVFGSWMRRLGYGERIISFEPLSDAFRGLEVRAAADGNWTAERCAVGANDGEVTIHVAGNDGLSSSVLPMLSACSDAVPSTAYVATERVRLSSLDQLLSGRTLGTSTFLKVDVQGYESAVLDGAKGLIDAGASIGMQLELSLVPLYEGEMTWREGIDRVEAFGMRLMDIHPAFRDPRTGQMLQIDALFFRP